MSFPERKFNDADIRSRPELLGVAVEYARDYAGEFDFMVLAQEYVRTTGTLPNTGTVRGVLNCMRLDLRAIHLLPDMDALDADTPPQTVAGRLSERNARRAKQPLAVVKEPDLRMSVDMPVRAKMPYVMARPAGDARRVIHFIDPTRKNFLRWARESQYDYHTKQYKVSPEWVRVEWYLHKLCSGLISFPIIMDETMISDRPFCRQCLVVKNELETRRGLGRR